MSERIIVVQDRQSVWDIAIREYGSVEAAFVLLRDNPTLSGLDAELQAGQQLRITSAPVDADVVEYYRLGGHFPVTEYVAPEEEDNSCAEASNSLQFGVSLNFSGEGSLSFFTDATHVAYKPPGGPRLIIAADDGFVILASLAVGAHCVFPCDAEGVAGGAFITFMDLNGVTLTGWNVSEEAFQVSVMNMAGVTFASSLEVLNLHAVAEVYMYIMSAPHPVQILAADCFLFDFQGDAFTDSLTLAESMPSCTLLYLIDLALPEALVDAAINAMSAANEGGQLAVLGGTSATPGAASATRRAELTAAGWSQFYN